MKSRQARGAIPCALAAGLLALFASATPAPAATIRATITAGEPIQKVWALQRTSSGAGTYTTPIEGKLDGNALTIDNLPPGKYDLRFQTATGLIEGWDAAVPESDYVEEEPLEEQSKQVITRKMGKKFATAFADKAWVLDIHGNIQNAALLLMQVRTSPFVGGAYQTGEWVFRVDRWQWEYPDEVTWQPSQAVPFYALVRERLRQPQFEAKHMTYARHLGGITLADAKAEVNLGDVLVPKPVLGVHAINPDGTVIEPIAVKPLPEVTGDPDAYEKGEVVPVAPKSDEAPATQPANRNTQGATP